MVGHRFVIEARDDVQVGVEPALIVPAERVAVGSESLVQFGSYQKQKFPCRRPLLGGQVERGSPVNFRGDAAAAGNYVRRITRVSGRGVDAQVVLEAQVRLAQPVMIAKDTAFGHRTVLLAGNPGAPPGRADEDADFNDVDQADPAEAFNAFERECAVSRRVLAQAPSLDVLSKQTSERTSQPWSLRWIVTHMIEEYARHNGHADLLRESIDGGTGYY